MDNKFINIKPLEQLKELGMISPFDDRLPTNDDISNVEAELNVSLPESYKKYLLEYSNIILGSYQLYKPFKDGSYLDMVQGVSEARNFQELPKHLIPFLYDNGDYFCFDTKSTPPDYEVIYWSHNGITDEKWDNFLDWVEKCWVAEFLSPNTEYPI